jgi:hypothetical protein
MKNPTAAQFLAKHSDMSSTDPKNRWSIADFETLEHLVEARDGAFAQAAAEDLHIAGRRVEDGQVVVDFTSAEVLPAGEPRVRKAFAPDFLAAVRLAS